MSDKENNDQAVPREINNANLFADDITFSDNGNILFEEDLHETNTESREKLKDGNPADRYTIVKKLNEGGMKSIWEVDDHRTARKIAMAIIQDSRIASEKDIDEFLYEARLTANLQHPNIIPIYDIALDEDGNPYFTMKALTGETLGQILKRKRNGETLPEYTRTRLLSIFVKVCDAMAYAHSKGVLHLDLKPSNVIIGDYGDVHVLDWGLSTLVSHLSDESSDEIAWHSPDHVELESGQTLTRYLESTSADRQHRNVIGGTPGYMAPEQAKASPADIDFRTDIFMLGAMLYEILTLHHAVEDDSVKEVLKKTVRGDIIPPVEHDQKIPPALAAIAMKALSPNRDDRYANVNALIRDVHQYQDGFATEAENPTFMTHLTLLILRHKKPVALIAAFTVIIIVILTNSIRSIKASERDAVVARNMATQSLQELQEKDEYIRATARKVAPDYLALYAAEEADYLFDQAQKALETSLTFEPANKKARLEKAIVSICQQQFTIAQNFLPPAHPLRSLAAQYKEPLTDAQLPAFVQQLQKLAPNALPRFFYHLNSQSSFNPQTRFTAFTQMLGNLNPKETELNFTYEAADTSWEIDISNNPGLNDITPLTRLPIIRLDASNTGDVDFKLLGDTIINLRIADTDANRLSSIRHLRNLEQLDISGTRIRNITNILDFPKLKSLDISRIDGLEISEQLIWCQSLRVVTVGAEHRNNPTLKKLADRGVIMIFK